MDIDKMTKETLAGMIDHTFLKAYAVYNDMKKLCAEAKQYGFAMVAVNSVQTALCKKLLEGSPVHVGAAISFPLGQTSIETKAYETARALDAGADEIDYVLNISELKAGNTDYIQREMSAIVDICRKYGAVSKVIFENCYLTREEIILAAAISRRVRPDFIKTSTGFGTEGALAKDVALMKKTVGDVVKIKAAGGIRDWNTCRSMIEAGAQRIGTSCGIRICEDFAVWKKSSEQKR